MAERTRDQKIIHVLAVLTAVVSLAPIGLGSLVTTLGAGMAFLDWPTSDGENMLLYNFLVDLREGQSDRFVEHSHRLAGALIGLCSIGLCGAAWKLKSSRAVRVACSLVLASVVVQGLIGGLRVLMNETAVAFAHSVFGCCVFVLLWIVAAATGRGWNIDPVSHSKQRVSNAASGLAVVFPVLCLIQYVMGGFIRHLGAMVHSHLGGACLVVLVACMVVAAGLRSGEPRLRLRSYLVGLAVLAQVGIGLFTWVTKFGFPPAGWVAVQHSVSQIVARSLHTVVGMVVVATAVSWASTVIRLRRASVQTPSGEVSGMMNPAV